MKTKETSTFATKLTDVGEFVDLNGTLKVTVMRNGLLVDGTLNHMVPVVGS